MSHAKVTRTLRPDVTDRSDKGTIGRMRVEGTTKYWLALCGLACFGMALAKPVAEGGQAQNSRPVPPLQSAIRLYRSGRLVQAEQQLRRILSQSPSDFEANELMGMVLANEGKSQEASKFLRSAVRLRPASAAARTNLAVVLVHLGQMQQAETEFRKAVEIEPGSYSANHNLGEFYVREGKLASAATYLANAQRAQPGAYDNGYDLALAYEKTGRLKEARQQIRLLLKRKNSADLHSLLAGVYEKDGNYVAAANEYETAAHLDPSQSNMLDWGLELLLHHTLDPAIEVFRHGLALYPRSTEMAIGLSVALYWKGDADQAVKTLLSACQDNPSDPRLYQFLNLIYRDSPKESAGVLDAFRRFTELEPRNGTAYYYYAMSLWALDQQLSGKEQAQKVEAYLKKSEMLDPRSADTYFQLGKLYIQQQLYKQSIPEFQRAIQIDPAMGRAHYLLMQAYGHTGHHRMAQREFRLYKDLHEKHVAESEKRQSEIKVFVIRMKNSKSGKR